MALNTACDRAPEAQPAPVTRTRTLRLAVPGLGRLLRVGVSLTGAREAPVVAALGGISASHLVCDRGAERGWWREMAGPGRPLDTRQIRLLGFEYPTPPGGALSTREQARVLLGVLDALGIERLDALVGASYGGMVGLALAQQCPQRLRRLVVVSAAHCSDPLTTAWRAIQRRIVRLGLVHGAGHDALVLARALAMTTYRSREEFGLRFAGPPALGAQGWTFPVEDYLVARGQDYAGRTAPERFLALSESLDLHAVDPERIRVPAHFVAVRQDQLVPLMQMRELARRYGGPAQLDEIDSLYGHDAFLKETALLGPILTAAWRCDNDV